jgi:hypothetical protein
MGKPWPLRLLALCFGAALLAATVAVVLSAVALFCLSFPADRLEAYPTDETRSDEPIVAPALNDNEAGAPRLAGPGDATHPDEAAVREILEIRREQGGLLDGTLLDELSCPQTDGPADGPADATARGRWQDEEFARALRGVATSASKARRQTSPQPEVLPSEIPQPEVPRPEISRGEPSPSALNNPHPSPVLGPFGGGSDEPVDDAKLVRALRYASRQLDRKANDLEDVQRYNDADQLRVLSDRLRQESRRWVPSS